MSTQTEPGIALADFFEARMDEAEQRIKNVEDYGGCCSGCHCGCDDPAAALAEIAIKRGVFDALKKALKETNDAASEDRGADAIMHFGQVSALLDIAQAYAKVYESHPDYPKEVASNG